MLGEICLPFCVLLKVKWVSIIMFPISDNEKIILHSDKKNNVCIVLYSSSGTGHNNRTLPNFMPDFRILKFIFYG